MTYYQHFPQGKSYGYALTFTGPACSGQGLVLQVLIGFAWGISIAMDGE